jgi:hypothetical protein
MHESYIMKKSLTQPQMMELKRKLPREFKQLDGAFHARAKQLGQAAASKGPELVAFHYSRLVEACAGCHSAFAKNRFPGFEHARVVKILMRLPDGNISAAHLSVLYNRLIRQHASLL